MRTATLVLVRTLWVASLIGFVLYAAPSTRQKLDLLQHGHPPAGTRIVFSSAELRTWLQEDQAFWAGYGVTNLRVNLAAGRATGLAEVDFLKARKAATGEDAGWILRNLFSGRKPLSVVARFSSAGGRARVDVERVEVNGIPVQGPALDLLIQDFVKPNFPDARVSEWFRLDYRIDHFTVAPGGVTVYVGK